MSGGGRTDALEGRVTGPLRPEGSLAQEDFAELVQRLHESRWSGVLTLIHKGHGKRIIVQDGRLVFASSSDPDERLGVLLLRKGRITLRQYMEAGQAVAPGKRFGAILVEQGVLSAKDLVRAVVEHTQEIIYGAFQWTEGQYRLQEQTNPAEAITLKISTPDLILEGIRRIEAWGRIDRGVGGLAAQYLRAEGYEGLLHQLTLTVEKLSLLTELNGVRKVESLCEESTLSDFDVCRALWAFRVIGLVRRVDAPAAVKPRVEDEGLGLVLAGE